jgi:AraC family transcriptional regulator
MSAPGSRPEYERRMHRVMEFIDRHLDQALDLETLAGVAHFSPFHFHRLFVAWTGETLGDYLRRRRLELAAMRLLAQPRVPVLDIALAVGFGSGEAFTRAFRSRFGQAPSGWRRHHAMRRSAQSKMDQVNSKQDQAADLMALHHGASSKPAREIVMNVKLVEREEITVAYMRHLGPYGAEIGRFWMEQVAPWMVTNGLMGRARYGLSHDDPGITAPEQCRYDACVEVQPDFVASGGAFVSTIPGGKYAVLRYKGNGADIGEAWASLLRDWLPASGLQLDARPCFEYYPTDAAYDPQTGVFECDICIPVLPL